jgi:hypothetical protein
VVQWKRIYRAERTYFHRSKPRYPTPTNHRDTNYVCIIVHYAKDYKA